MTDRNRIVENKSKQKFGKTNQSQIRLLFLHATREVNSEYAVHRLLADHADSSSVTCRFLWQKNSSEPQHLKRDTIYWDFGRDMSLDPRPSRLHRALMMVRAFPGSFRLIQRWIKAFRPDILYTSQQFYEVFLGRLFSRLHHLPHFIHISYPVGPWLGNWTLRTIQRTQNLIACSDFVRRTALSHGVHPNQIETLLHGANLSDYALPKDRKWLHDLAGWPEKCPIVVTAARIDPYKGYPDLLHAFAIAHQQMPNLRLLVCGNGTTGTGYEKMIKQLAVELGLEGSSVFLGYHNELPRIFAGADIFFLPTRLDALPLVFLGAMAAGLPAVAVRSGGVPEMVIDGETGLLAEPGDVDCLAEHLLNLSRNPELAEKMGQAGKQRAMHEFDPDSIAEQWVDILNRRLNLRKSPF